jgi:hypothetical protein
VRKCRTWRARTHYNTQTKKFQITHTQVKTPPPHSFSLIIPAPEMTTCARIEGPGSHSPVPCLTACTWPSYCLRTSSAAQRCRSRTGATCLSTHLSPPVCVCVCVRVWGGGVIRMIGCSDWMVALASVFMSVPMSVSMSAGPTNIRAAVRCKMTHTTQLITHRNTQS